MKLAHWSEIQKYSNSPGPLEKSTVCSVVDSCKASLLLDGTHSNAEITDNEKEIMASSFRDKLWNWEKVSSQKSEMSSALLLANCGSKAFHLKGNKGMGLTQEESRKKLQRREAQTLPSQRHLSQRKLFAASEDPAFVLSQHGKKSEESPSPDRSPTGSICQPIYEYELASQAPEKQSDVRHHQLPKTKPMPSIESLGPPPPKPSKPPAVNLQAFREQQAALAETHRRGDNAAAAAAATAFPWGWTSITTCFHAEAVAACPAEFEEPHNYEATISYLRHSGNSINLCTAKEIADSTYKVEIEELRKPWKSFLHREPSPKCEDDGKKMKEEEPFELDTGKTEKDPHSNHPFKVVAYQGTPQKIQMATVHRERKNMLAENQDALTDINQMKACPKGTKLTEHSQGPGTYVEALEMSQETPDTGALKPSSISEETYDDVEYPMRETPKLEFSDSFASDSELRSQEVTIYDDVDMSEKESKDEDKVKTWKPKFLIPKEKKEKKGAEGSDRTKKQNLEKNRMEKEEKLFRESSEYDKEIIVINTAVACSNNSRNGTFDLPITPGEVLEVIDTTEQNLVLCRNSKGKCYMCTLLMVQEIGKLLVLALSFTEPYLELEIMPYDTWFVVQMNGCGRVPGDEESNEFCISKAVYSSSGKYYEVALCFPKQARTHLEVQWKRACTACKLWKLTKVLRAKTVFANQRTNNQEREPDNTQTLSRRGETEDQVLPVKEPVRELEREWLSAVAESKLDLGLCKPAAEQERWGVEEPDLCSATSSETGQRRTIYMQGAFAQALSVMLLYSEY
ncbi:hypothetical protein TREES_T100006382 [Tupaia chinensis]|uniref:Helically-extended SH3 domain-containing protein n=1 Tax=Tupaia chinensis TaxID=246437 RepID=L9KZS4_TUPCH|nr:hypothetical protein TREES_T100006382 [Tupaia chinensis]